MNRLLTSDAAIVIVGCNVALRARSEVASFEFNFRVIQPQTSQNAVCGQSQHGRLWVKVDPRSVRRFSFVIAANARQREIDDSLPRRRLVKLPQ
jgi:hypothetical protein